MKHHKGMMLVNDFESPGELGRFVGSTWEGVNDEMIDGVYNYISQQILYVKTFVKNAEESIIKLGGKPLKQYETPAVHHDHKKNCPEIDEVPGKYADIAPSVVCAILYVARSTRLDILFATCRLTRYLTRWTLRQDDWLLRLLGFLKFSAEWALHFAICPEEFEQKGGIKFENWSDSDLAGDPPTKRSTSGGCGFLKGKKTRALVHAYCKRQGQVSASTPESETTGFIVLGKRTIPLHLMIMRLLKSFIDLEYLGDNSASERVVGTGFSAALAYMKRTAEISLYWAKENMAKYIKRTPTDENISDIFTKPLEKEKFNKFRIALGIY